LLNCQICNHPTKVIHQKSFNIDFRYCWHCEFLFKDPKDYITVEEEKVIYDRHENSIDDPRYIAFFQKFLEESLFPYIAPQSTGLDFGSGPQPVLATLLRDKYSYEMDLYDLHYHNIEIPQDKEYDFITCTEVIEHIDHPLDTFEFLKSHLKVGGVLAMMTMFHRKDEAFFMNWHYMRDMSHISFFTEKTLRYIAEILGLEVLYCDGKRHITFRRLDD